MIPLLLILRSGLESAMLKLMPSPRTILKIGVAVVQDDRLLLVRKAGLGPLILPGGKPEVGESDMQTIVREIREELDCEIDPHSLAFVATFKDRKAGAGRDMVCVSLYRAALSGMPTPSSEIQELVWCHPADAQNHLLAPSITNQILPHLVAIGVLTSAREEPLSAAG
jgi:8-oxo-dGTP diphosphatase